MGKKTLLLGGARSGKSHYALELAKKFKGKAVLIVTGIPCDEEMKARIERHKKARPKSLKVIEEPINIKNILKRVDRSVEIILIDCLTLWVSNLMQDYQDKGKKPLFASYPNVETTRRVVSTIELEERIFSKVLQLVSTLKVVKPKVIIVSNEVGMGIVPETQQGRLFRDILGRANQVMADLADEVFLLVAGLPIKLKGSVKNVMKPQINTD
ncbi:MAG: bifunctional adenosylcobinamide kinase/adenosylcobinamide-phosphate guanylyltransferase [Armatimonadetes bacterium CG07_land_8_20_14_0_80_40_9]|nr:MAG: bifunctional adenosylcobinamide kinase/adenosylcobinamide-phosphate guanylyltransferase [Armatimonadetes bacterium CG07_land_8_20_14_0_80_40_9]